MKVLKSAFVLAGTVVPALGFVMPLVSHGVRTCSRLHAASDGAAAPTSVLTGAFSPLAARNLKVFENEDSTERYTELRFEPDGTLSLISDSTQAIEIDGNWRQVNGKKLGFIIERFYQTDAGSRYSMTRLYEGEFEVAGRSLCGEGRIEQEKYNDTFTCGYFSLISIDDGPDEIDSIPHREVEGIETKGVDF